MSKVEEIYARATAGDRVAQYDLAVYFGEMSRKVDQREKVDYCLDQVLIWLKKSASQGYAPAKEALNDIQEKFELTEAEKVPEPEPVQPVPQPRKSVQTASTRSDVPRQPRAWVPDTQDSRPAPAAEADDTKPYIPYGAANKPVKKKSKESRLIIIIAAAVCVALIIFGVIKAAKLFTQSSRPGEVADDEQEKQEEQKQEEQEEQDAEKEEKTEE